MELDRTEATISRGDTELRAYMVKPAMVAGPLPAIIVIQEIWGVDAHIRDVCDRFATSGYVALAPDLYYHGGTPAALSLERIEEVKRLMDEVGAALWDPAAREAKLAEKGPDVAKRVGETMGAILGPRDEGAMIDDIEAFVDLLARHPWTTGRPVASIGYCMGGALSFALAGRGRAMACAFVYYGHGPTPEEAARVTCPVYGFYGETDRRLTEDVPEVAELMNSRGKTYEPVVYGGAGHAFFNDSRRSFHPESARLAWARTLDLLAKHTV